MFQPHVGTKLQKQFNCHYQSLKHHPAMYIQLYSSFNDSKEKKQKQAKQAS